MFQYEVHRGGQSAPVMSSLSVILSISLVLLSGCVNPPPPTQESAAQTSTPAVAAEPEPPKGLVASADSAEEIVLTWQQPPAGTTHYTIERKSGTNADFAPIASYVPATVLEYRDKVSPDTEYVYQVRPHQATATGESVAGPVTVKTPPLEPLAPEHLDAKAAGQDQVSLSWGEAPNAARYAVLRSDKADGEYFVIDTVEDKQVFVDKDLAPGTEYWYVIRAMNDGKAFAETAPVSVRTAGVVQQAPPPPPRPAHTPEPEGPPPPPVSPPRYVEARAVSPEMVLLKWSSAPNVNTFTILRADERSGFYRIIATVRGRLDYSDAGLMPDSEYFYKVRAHGFGGWLADSRPVSVRMPVPPPPPVIVIPPRPPRPEPPARVEIASVSPYQVELRWRESANADRYAILRSESRHGRFSPIDTVHDRHHYRDHDVAPNTQYWYKIRAFNSSWMVADSDVISAHTDPIPEGATPVPTPVPPEAPKSVKAKAVSPTQINLAWSEAANAQSFLVLRSDKRDGDYFPLERIENKWSYSDKGLDPDTEYWYKIRAISTGSGTAETRPVSARTQAAPTPTASPSPSPSPSPTPQPTEPPTPSPSPSPTASPTPPKTPKPTMVPTRPPVSTVQPTPEPLATAEPTRKIVVPIPPVRTVRPIGTARPVQTVKPPVLHTVAPTTVQTAKPTTVQTAKPTTVQTVKPTAVQTAKPTIVQTVKPTTVQTVKPTPVATLKPTAIQTVKPMGGIAPKIEEKKTIIEPAASSTPAATKETEAQESARRRGRDGDSRLDRRELRQERRETLRNAIADETTTGTAVSRRDLRGLRERPRSRN